MEGEEITVGISPQKGSFSFQNDEQSLYFVPYKWWKEARDSCLACDSDKKEAVLYTAVQTSYGGPLKIFNMFYPDLMFNLNRDDECMQRNEIGEVGILSKDYALVHGDVWLEALKWHSSKNTPKNGKSFSEDEMSDVYPLQLRLSVLQEKKSLGVKISKKDNTVERFRRACKIFNPESESLRIWDFSGKTTTFLFNDETKAATDAQSQAENEILLELQVYGTDLKKKEGLVVPNNNGKLCFMNNSTSVRGESGSLGLTGLQNLGNTCFMNSALQCLTHTPKLIDYFLGDYCAEINHSNPLGMDGEIALAFGDLLRRLWAPGASALAPRVFKSKLARFAPQFNGFNQHDSQELLAFLLDGLHEDLNRVKCKPYAEVKDGDGRPDEEVADEYWHNHLARNDSIIVDVCQGQYRSTLVCPICQKTSVTFDPFMYLSLPLPSTTTRRMTLTLISSDGSKTPSPFTVTVPKLGKFEDLIEGLTNACSLGVDEILLVAEIYNSRIIRYLGESKDSLSLIRDADCLVAYKLPKDTDNVQSIVFIHQHAEETYIAGKLLRSWKAFGIPLLANSKLSSGSDIINFYIQSLGAFGIPGDEFVLDNDKIEKAPAINEMKYTEDSSTPSLSEGADPNDGDPAATKLEFYLTDEKGIIKNEISMDWLLENNVLHERLNVVVRWPDMMFKKYESRLFITSLPQVFKFDFSAKTPQDSVTLYKCLEGFLKEEPLGPEDMWYCPSCKKHCQASKKLDLWRLPEILVIHLKRFSYNRFLKNKLEIKVDFPVHDLDLSEYICYHNGQKSNRYMLYAMSNHYGSMGGGHYTAFVRHGGDQWYDFDDSRVSAIDEDRIKTSAAYVLFYRRVENVKEC